MHRHYPDDQRFTQQRVACIELKFVRGLQHGTTGGIPVKCYYAAVAILLCTPTAGIAADFSPRIIGGEDVSSPYPWMAGLHRFTPNPPPGSYSTFPFCGGSLIAPGWVVTAAHCITDIGTGANPSLYSQTEANTLVRLNRPNLEDQPAFFVEEITVHPQYGIVDQDDSDIALVRLTDKNGLRTVSLANQAIMTQLENSKRLDDILQIIGWGVFDGDGFQPSNASSGPQPMMLQVANIDYLPFKLAECRNAWGGLTNNMICAWEPEPNLEQNPFGQDSCFGDSGGPLLLPKGTQLSAGKVAHDWVLGATSFGNSRCNSNTTPGVYTRLANFAGWIEQVSANAGDPLTDLAATITMPDLALPDQTLPITIGLRNDSVNNTVTGVSLRLDHPQLQVRINHQGDLQCNSSVERLNCTLLTPMLPGDAQQLRLEADWLGGIDEIGTLRARLTQDQDDYRIGNNDVRQRTLFSFSPDPALGPLSIVRSSGSTATLQVTARNLSRQNTAEQVELIIRVPPEQTFRGLQNGKGCVRDGASWRCPMNDLLPGASRTTLLDVAGKGTFEVVVALQNSNGDVAPGDTESRVTVTLKSSSGSLSGLVLLGLVLLVLVLLRTQRPVR